MEYAELRFSAQESASPYIFAVTQEIVDWDDSPAEDELYFNQAMWILFSLTGLGMFYIGICVGFCICHRARQYHAKMENQEQSELQAKAF